MTWRGTPVVEMPRHEARALLAERHVAIADERAVLEVRPEARAAAAYAQREARERLVLARLAGVLRPDAVGLERSHEVAAWLRGARLPLDELDALARGLVPSPERPA